VRGETAYFQRAAKTVRTSQKAISLGYCMTVNRPPGLVNPPMPLKRGQGSLAHPNLRRAYISPTWQQWLGLVAAMKMDHLGSINDRGCQTWQ